MLVHASSYVVIQFRYNKVIWIKRFEVRQDKGLQWAIPELLLVPPKCKATDMKMIFYS